MLQEDIHGRKNKLVEFWEDLLNLHEDRYHYIGLLFLKAVNKEILRLWGEDSWLIDIGYKAYHVVDGKQRLTTFSILINEIKPFIKKLDENQEKSDGQVFIGFGPSKGFLISLILSSATLTHCSSIFLLMVVGLQEFFSTSSVLIPIGKDSIIVKNIWL